MNTNRRRVIAAAVAGGLGGLAGCTGGDVVGGIGDGGDGDDGDDGASSGDDGAAGADDEPTEIPENAPPTADRPLHLDHDVEFMLNESLSGGVGQDGIPSIDEPRFRPIGESDLDDDAPVFGVVRNGEARAYPQYVLVWHEIVNDEIGGERVAVTYCPLTGTAQGFERGDAQFGVSGHLVNSNLIMYDRSTDSWYPQMVATGIDGPMTGHSLREFQVVWTTLGEWRAEHPDSEVLTDETGYARRYGNDPYGEYDPLGGYYVEDRTMFAPLESADEGHMKSVVIGARTDAVAIAFDKETLLHERVLTGTVAESGDAVDVVAVADPALSTGYVYRNPDGDVVEPEGDGYRVEGNGEADGGAVDADDLPLDRLVAFDAMWFAWAGFYPTTEFVGNHTEPGYGR